MKRNSRKRFQFEYQISGTRLPFNAVAAGSSRKLNYFERGIARRDLKLHWLDNQVKSRIIARSMSLRNLNKGHAHRLGSSDAGLE